MNGLFAILRREVKAYLLSPLSYVFLAAFLLASGALTFEAGGFLETGRVDLSPFFVWHPWLYAVFLPALGMRLWAEDARSGALELLLTLPVSTAALVIGKWLAVWLFAGAALVLTGPIWASAHWLGAPDDGAILAAYLTSWLMAGGYLAVASAASALFSSQTAAFVVGGGVCALLTAAGAPIVTGGLADALGPWAAEAGAALSFATHFDRAVQGVIEGGAVFYLVSLIAASLYITGVLVTRRRGG